MMQQVDQAPTTPPPVDAAPRSMAETTQWLTQAGLEWGSKIVLVVVLLILAWMLGAWARRAIGRLLDRPSVDQTLGRFLGNMARWVILLMAIIGCLGFFGFNITSVAALVGAAGLTVGLALQGSLANIAAGIMLLILRPFKIGDVVQLSGCIGRVDDIDLFHTKVDTFDNRRMIIPNGQIFGTTIENITHHPWRRCDVPVGVAYHADLRATRAALKAAAETFSKRDPSKPVEIVLMNLGNSAVEWSVRVWVPSAEFLISKDEITQAVKDHLDAADLPIPFPQMDIWVRNALSLSSEGRSGSA